MTTLGQLWRNQKKTDQGNGAKTWNSKKKKKRKLQELAIIIKLQHISSESNPVLPFENSIKNSNVKKVEVENWKKIQIIEKIEKIELWKLELKNRGKMFLKNFET